MIDNAKFILSKSVALKQLKIAVAHADIVSYSYKTNNEVGDVLQKDSNCEFNIHSVQAAEKIKDKSRMWFFAQAWSKEELNKLFLMGINSFIVDNINDLNKLLKYIKNKQTKIRLLLRMRLKEHSVRTGKHFVYGFFSKQINELVSGLAENSKIKELGVHFHRKTQNISEWSLRRELEQSLDNKTLDLIDYVNIGGGLPAVYKNYRPEIINGILKKIDELRKWLNSQNIKMIVEPGRFIAAPAVKLIAEIKNIYNNNIVVNASVYNSAMDTFIANIRLLVEWELSADKGEAYTIKGCTPDSLDIFRYKVFLKNPKIGDKIVFLNAGAYNFSTDFCMLPKLETKIVD
ncbi:MAG: Diaminopimelate decarboxylase [Candidatus Woesearchaeota archaeon]|nr:Diaminopimelate decarboxylase [Candidatus Woesearchaeota archaeon]